MKKNTDPKQNNSVKMMVTYGIIVFFVIFIALLLRAYTVIKESKFDGLHRFTLALSEGEKVRGLISFEPATSSLSLLTFTSNSYLPFSELNRKVGIIPDGYIKTRYLISMSNALPSTLQSLLFQWNNTSKNITFYDLLQFWYYTNKIPVSTISTRELPVSSDTSAFNRAISLLFIDNKIFTENISIQIINASGASGLGSRLERAISNIGGNVVSVQTAAKNESKSKIKYYASGSHTLQKLQSLLPFRPEKLKKQAIAEIVIILGTDSKETKIF